jgi:hypothetical protein
MTKNTTTKNFKPAVIHSIFTSYIFSHRRQYTDHHRSLSLYLFILILVKSLGGGSSGSSSSSRR